MSICIVKDVLPTFFREGFDVKKWMRLAKSVKDVENPCYSRQIGVVIVDQETNSLISSGHNGPPQNCPPNDNIDYLQNVVWPQLTESEKLIAKEKYNYKPDYNVSEDQLFASNFQNCKTCPRRLIDVPSGQRLELCSCIHGEVDAITRANRSVVGCCMVCYCGVPCIECSKVIINSGIAITEL